MTSGAPIGRCIGCGQVMRPGAGCRTSQFWFESFQNWQSEFLAVGELVVLSIYLRQKGSPESKVAAAHAETGTEERVSGARVEEL